MKKLAVLFFICMISTMLFATPKSHKCPLCYGTMMWTGETKTEWGKLLKQYKCPLGHFEWRTN